MTTKRMAVAVAALIVVGMVGWLGFLVYAERPGAGEAAPPGAGDQSAHAALLAQPHEASNAQARLTVSIDPQTGAEVGNLITFTAKVADLTTSQPVTNVLFTVQHWHTEDQKVVFASQAVGPDGTLSWQFNAHDGVPYEIRVTAAPTTQSSVSFGALNVQPVAVVDPLAPPLRVKLLNLFYLVAIVGLGVALGVWLAVRRAAAAEPRRTTRRTVIAPSLGR